MSTNHEVSKNVKDVLTTLKGLIDEIIDAHDKLNDFINKKAPNGSIKDEDYSEYMELSIRFKDLTKRFSDVIEQKL